ncbi:G-protein coupled receptor GRL101-like isoform X2 [Haliotis rufescens]|uniref:G-protein coupled receptor GRL101-like isoform X2 n=1 Tax=Haliotis rufescens TaxID=6454 RepID=UPI00201F555F|nr:G-protein coupled receptor GRL101-like isoform X2 [Haliotis rufescens]
MTYTNWGTDGVDGGTLQRCFLKNMTEDGWQDVFCNDKVARTILCSNEVPDIKHLHDTPSLPEANSSGYDHELFTNCTNGELVSKFNLCDGRFDCKDRSDESNCGTSCTSTQFQCTKIRCVSFSFYCDGTRDCADGSDENCEKGSCASEEWQCRNGQCIDSGKRCDLFEDCYDKTDEADCEICRSFVCFDGKCIPNSWVNDGVVDCDGFKGEDESEYTITNGLVECEETHYKCPNSYCIPIQYVANGLKDCPDGADECGRHEYRCPGYYPCSGETYCIPPSQLCDGIRHCPDGDDERMCQSECPPSCICSGRVIRCDSNFKDMSQIPFDVRKLDLSGVDLHLLYCRVWLPYLTVLILSSSNIIRIEGVFPKLPNLLTLDVSHNMISHLVKDSFSNFTNLKHLDLSNNVNLSNIDNGTFAKLSKLEQLNLFNTCIMELKSTVLLGLSNLRTLNISHSQMNYINVGSFSSLRFLECLDISQNKIQNFNKGIFDGLPSLKQLQTDSYKLCCDSVRPKSLTTSGCLSSKSTIASCEDLLGQDILRILLWVIALVAVVGNILVIIYRFIYDRKSLQKSYGVLVTNLSIADFFMGLYMMIIGFVDSSFKGSYVWHDYEWRHSTLCAFAGFLSTLSSEASCIFITLITLDRLLAVAFPFGQFRFSLKTAVLSAAISWIIAILLAGIPLLPSLKWNLYSQNSVCLALPLSNDRQPGWEYSTGIFVGFNFVMFLLIGICQVLIYRAVTTSSTIRSSKSSHDTTIARRLIIVVLTDFLCWFPVGVMGEYYEMQ